MDGADDSEDKIEVLASTENDAQAEGEQATGAQNSNITEKQWDAIKALLEYLLNYRDEEYVIQLD